MRKGDDSAERNDNGGFQMRDQLSFRLYPKLLSVPFALSLRRLAGQRRSHARKHGQGDAFGVARLRGLGP